MMQGLSDTYHHILETMHDGVLALSGTGEIILFNQAASDILGIKPDEALGKLLVEVFLAEGDRNDEFTETVLDAVYKRGDGLRTSAPYVRPDGKEMFLDIASSYMPAGEGDGQSGGVVLVFTDITELRAQYDKERELTSQLSEAYRDLEGKTDSLRTSVHRSRLKRRLGLGVILLVLLAAAAFLVQRYAPFGSGSGGGGGPMDMVGGQDYQVQPSSVSLTVSLSGNFEPLDIVNIVCPFNGRVTEKHFDFGQRVGKGDVLLKLDTSELMVKLRDNESAYIKAQQEYATVHNWDKSLEVSNARRAYAKAKKALDTSRHKLESSKDLLDRGIIPEDEYANELNSFENMELDFSSSKEQLQSVLDKGSADNVLVAEMAMKNAQFNYESVKEKIAQAVIAAPVGGLVVRPQSTEQKNSKAVEVGTSFNEGEILLSIGNMEGFTVRTKADEVDMVKLRVGQPVTISGDAFPDMSLKGRIKSISSQAEVGMGMNRTATFEVVVQVDDLTDAQRERIKLGMMATMEVQVYENDQAVTVPIGAVHKGEGGWYVMVRTPGGLERRDVEVGMTTLDAVEITRGLEPGDEVEVSPEPGGRGSMGGGDTGSNADEMKNLRAF